ncbi:hypothetical protein BGZ76_004503 [Entomortierella beljakovae]|nr:hypothetical protein BGZ76_004503 [Entomortierella beljakovae]
MERATPTSLTSQTNNNTLIQVYDTATTIMPLFKSNKNNTSSAATTPAQTPRTSMQEPRPSQSYTVTKEKALEIALGKIDRINGPMNNLM